MTGVSPYTQPGVAVNPAQQNFVPRPPLPMIDLDTETDSNHDTALTLACAGGHEELIELLLSRGADIGK